MNVLMLAAGWVLVVFVGLAGLIVLWRMYQNEINLSLLVSESTGEASLSRFQFLIFTFVIALSLAYIVFVTKTFPDVDEGIWALLGISGGSYVISKGIQKSGGSPNGDGKPKPKA